MRPRLPAGRAQHGLTLVELMVALAVSLVVALAAIAALIFSQRGFSTVDAAGELRDNARFGAGMLQRIAMQAGYLDWQYAMVPRKAQEDLTDPPPNVQGFNNADLPVSSPFNAATDPLASVATRTAACNTPQGLGCSDILVVRYQAQTIPGAALPGSAPVSDQTMIDCSGRALAEGPRSRDDQGISIFYVAQYRGEPALMCMSGRQTAANAVLTTTWQAPVPVISGVENFQVLYGTDNVTPGAAPSASATSVPNRYLRADQFAVSGNAVATNNNWRRVRSLRIGLLLRGPVGSQQGTDNSVTFYPLGMGRSGSADSTKGLALSSDLDLGTRFNPPADNRLRQSMTFTVYLHNDQGLCIGRTCTLQ